VTRSRKSTGSKKNPENTPGPIVIIDLESSEEEPKGQNKRKEYVEASGRKFPEGQKAPRATVRRIKVKLEKPDGRTEPSVVPEEVSPPAPVVSSPVEAPEDQLVDDDDDADARPGTEDENVDASPLGDEAQSPDNEEDEEEEEDDRDEPVEDGLSPGDTNGADMNGADEDDNGYEGGAQESPENGHGDQDVGYEDREGEEVSGYDDRSGEDQGGQVGTPVEAPSGSQEAGNLPHGTQVTEPVVEEEKPEQVPPPAPTPENPEDVILPNVQDGPQDNTDAADIEPPSLDLLHHNYAVRPVVRNPLLRNHGLWVHYGPTFPKKRAYIFGLEDFTTRARVNPNSGRVYHELVPLGMPDAFWEIS